jgi:3-phosphoshikimate 1-carboxyvinyltransferase
MMQALRALGQQILEEGSENNEVWRVIPAPLMGPAEIDVGNAGTVMRFLPPVAALAQGVISFDGDLRSHERPLAPVIAALENFGVSIDHGKRYSLPMTINGSGKIKGGLVEIDASTSSQFVSALLLVGPRMEEGLILQNIGPALPSQPHIDMTISMLKKFGARVEVIDHHAWKVDPSRLHGSEVIIEPDLSNAAPFLSLALVSGGKITIRDWPRQTDQPGDQLREILTAMGADCEFTDLGLQVRGNGEIRGIDIDLHDVGELTPAIAALAALAQSPSTLRGIGHLRLHETDRLAALTREINALGGRVTEFETALHFEPAPLHSGIFHTYEDHRLATAAAVLGLVTPGITVENIETTRKTLPDFPDLWSSILDA